MVRVECFTSYLLFLYFLLYFNNISGVIVTHAVSDKCNYSNIDNTIKQYSIRDCKKNLQLSSAFISVENLSITNNEFGSISASQINYHLENVRTLKIMNNKLQSIDSNLFENITKLEELTIIERNLSLNNLETFPKQLKTIHLELMKVSNQFLANLPENLTELTIINTVIENGFVANENRKFDKLLNFTMKNCSQQRIYRNLYSKIKFMDLSRNLLTSELSDLGKLVDLRELNLSFNRIVYITVWDFALLSSLEYLNLKHNNIKVIHTHAFEQNEKLFIVDLSFNKLTELMLTKTSTQNYSIAFSGNYLWCPVKAKGENLIFCGEIMSASQILNFVLVFMILLLFLFIFIMKLRHTRITMNNTRKLIELQEIAKPTHIGSEYSFDVQRDTNHRAVKSQTVGDSVDLYEEVANEEGAYYDTVAGDDISGGSVNGYDKVIPSKWSPISRLFSRTFN